MRIVKKDTMPDGTKIQLEDWREDNLGFIIGAYPIARNSGSYGFVIAGRTFRLSIATNKYAEYTNADVAADYEALVSGQKTLEDLAEHFWNGEKDKWYMGMFKPYTDKWYEAQTKYQLHERMY